MTTNVITEDTSRDSSSTRPSRCSVLDALSPPDRRCIDAAANAWINGGGDAEGLAWMWRKLQERVRELS